MQRNNHLRFSTVTKRDNSLVRFDKSKIAYAIKKAILAVERRPKRPTGETASIFADEVVAELHLRCIGRDTVHVETIQDAITDVLHRDFARGRDSLSSKPESLWMAYMLYREGHCLVRNGQLKPEHFHPDTRPKSKIEALRGWVERFGCGTVKGLNDWFKGNDLRYLIGEAERRSDEELESVVHRLDSAISEGGLRAMLVTGPSSSGKTVTTQRTLGMLKRMRPDVTFKSIEVDMYFVDNKHSEKLYYDIDGKNVEDVNFELPHTYDLALFNEHLDSLLKGRTVMVPRYDFKEGRRLEESHPMRLGKDEILLIDCMHALHPRLTEAIPTRSKLKVYLEPLAVLQDGESRPVYLTDIRLLRRMIRDVRTRGYSIPGTLWHWHLVRRGERFILPFVHSADMVVDSGLPYELPVLKMFLEREIKELLPMFERNPDLFDGRERAKRILRLFSQMRAAEDSQLSMIRGDSVLREFIGGSVFFDK